MSSTSLIRIQQSSLINQNNSVNNNEKHTINMFNLFFHIFNYIYLLNTRLFFYFLLLIKRLSRFIFGFWTFLFVTLRGSRKRVDIEDKNEKIKSNYLF